MAALAVSVLAPLGMSIATAAPASADQAWGPAPATDSAIPSYMSTTGGAGNDWFDKKWPGRSTAVGGGGEPLESSDAWLYPDFPIACNPTPGDTNHYKVYYVHAASQASTYDQAYVRKALRAASSVFAASAREKIGTVEPGGTPLREVHAPRWKTTAPGGAGNCYPEVTVVSVPDEVLTVGSGNGFWSPFRSGELDDYLLNQGIIVKDKDEKPVVLLQEWGSPQDAVGVTGVVANTVPDKSNPNNAGGTFKGTIYAEVEGDPTGDNEWATTAHTLAHEITHNLGGMSSSQSPNWYSGGHATDCYDVLCERAGNPDYHPVAACGATASYGLTEMRESKFYNRLDCQGDDYWSINGAPWTQTRWNGYNNSFLWANAGNEQ